MAIPRDLPAAFAAWSVAEEVAFSVAVTPVAHGDPVYQLVGALYLPDGNKLSASKVFVPELDRSDLYGQLDELRELVREELRDMACHRLYDEARKTGGR